MVVQHGPLRIGVIHGHQVVPLGDPEMLGATARKMDVDVLISGGTHRYVPRPALSLSLAYSRPLFRARARRRLHTVPGC